MRFTPRFVGRVVFIFAVVMLAVMHQAGPVSAQTQAVVATDALNLRQGPGLSETILDVMNDGAEVSVLDGPTGDGWYKVRYAGEVGWAFGGYLSINGESAWSIGSADAQPERWIDVNRSSQTVTLYAGDEAIASYWGAMGWDKSDDGFYATANGTFFIYAKNAALTWTDWGQVYITDWVAFDPDRSNGFHGYSMDSAGNVLPNGNGPTGGCVALAPWAADQLYAFAEIGMRVEVHW
jgi:hypothetical protein